MTITPAEIIDYWFSDRLKVHWFSSTPELDTEIRHRYKGAWEKAALGELDAWIDTPDGCLALIIILDQFPLNMFRGKPAGFSTEEKAITTTHHAINNKFDQQLQKNMLPFLYIPLMHSEKLADQDLSVELFTKANLEANIKFAMHHRDIVKKFGRFPHRNSILGRKSTAEEIEYLASEKAFKG